MKKIILTACAVLIAFASIVNAGNKTNKKADCCNGGACCSPTSLCCASK